MFRKHKDSLNELSDSKYHKLKSEKTFVDYEIDLNEDEETIEERRIAEQREKRKALLEKLAAKEVENDFSNNNISNIDNRFFN